MIWILGILASFAAWAVLFFQNIGKTGAGIFSGLMAGIAGIFTVICMLTFVESGESKTLTQFGIATNQDLDKGVYMIAPWKSTVDPYNVRRDFVEFSESTENALIAMSKDKTEMQVDLLYPYKLSSGYFGKLYEEVGGPAWFKATVLAKAAKSTVRDIIPKYNWKESATTKKAEIAIALQTSFEEKVTNSLMQSGFTADEVTHIIDFQKVELRRVRPTKDAILDAVADKLAEKEELEKQKTTTQIADEIALRRTKEGKGISNLFGQLPKKYTPAEVALVLHAMADKVRADSIMKSISQQKGSVSIMAIPSTAAVAIK